MKNKVFPIMLIMMLILSSLNVAAFNDESHFDDYVILAMSHQDSFSVISGDGMDVTDDFLNIVSTSGLNQAHEFALQNDCCITYQEIAECSDLMPYALSQSASVTQYFYHLQKDTKGKYQKEWQTKLSGTYRYDRASGEIKGASAPSILLSYTNFGAAFSPYMDSVNTYYRINTNTNTVSFYGSYHMYATLGLSIGDFPVGFTFDFSAHTDKFSVTR